MPHHFVRTSGNPLTPEVVSRRIYRNWVETRLKMSVEDAETIASSNAELKGVLADVKFVAARSSSRYGGGL